MVENKNYKNNGRRYNRKGNFRNYKNSAPMKKKGLLSFLFSFNGKISKELYMGAALPLVALLALTSSLPTTPEQKILNILFSVLFVISIFMVMAVSFKRSHALNISGIYSIASEYFIPFFL